MKCIVSFEVEVGPVCEHEATAESPHFAACWPTADQVAEVFGGFVTNEVSALTHLVFSEEIDGEIDERWATVSCRFVDCEEVRG